jgi:tellurite resistance protein
MVHLKSLACQFGSLVVIAWITVTPAVAQTKSHSTIEIQRALLQQGLNLGTADGAWGKRSTAALKEFQKEHGLEPTGLFDPETSAELFPSLPLTEPPRVDSATILQPEPNRDISAVARHQMDYPPVAEPEGSRTTVQLKATQPPPIQTKQKSDAIVPSAAPMEFIPSGRPAPNSAIGFSPALGALIAIVVGLALLILRRRKKPAGLPTISLSVDLNRPANSTNRDILIAARLASELNNSLATLKAEISTVPDPIAAPENRFPPQLRVIEATPIKSAFGQRLKPTTNARTTSTWIMANTRIKIGDSTIAGGMIFVGSKLPKVGNPYETDNCLIDPKLPIALQKDGSENAIGYWPSYSQISPSARKAYLDWLASPRDNPEANLGFVFLYFYGLERRLMLEPNSPDKADVVEEVHRLLKIYGQNGSFQRYAGALLSAHELLTKSLPENYMPTAEGNGYEVPLSVKIALGMRVHRGRPIEPELLLLYVMTHPETRVRTPAKRAFPVVEELFSNEVQKAYPNGVIVARGKSKKVIGSYRASSGSFEIPITPQTDALPDITERSEPITTARRIFDACVDAVDGYSRELGRTEGMKTTLGAIARLPPALRRKKAGQLEGKPLDQLDRSAETGAMMTLRQLSEDIGMGASHNFGKNKLRELSVLLKAFGYGVTADPAYSLRATMPDDLVSIFKLEDISETESAVTEGYASAKLSIMLGISVALADGKVHALERERLNSMVATSPSLSVDERMRLRAELQVEIENPRRLAEWKKRLNDAPAASHSRIAQELVAVATADGVIDPREVTHLEKLFKQMGMETQLLYDQLHNGSGVESQSLDEALEIVVPAVRSNEIPIPSQPKKVAAPRVDFDRLAAIRHETKSTASVLAEIFADEEVLFNEKPPSVPNEVDLSAPDEGTDGLEQRYAVFLSELRGQSEWSAEEFDQLARRANLFPGAAKEALNDWSLDRFDELILEGGDPIEINIHLLPVEVFGLILDHNSGERTSI